MEPVISVIIATYNRRKDLEKCLEALVSQTFSPFEIIVVDGGSNDGTRELLKKYQVKVIRFETRKASTVALNNGIRKAVGKIIAITDDDTIPNEYWLENIYKTFMMDENIGAVCGGVINLNKNISSSYVTIKNFVSNSNLLVNFLWRVYHTIFMGGKLPKVGTLYSSGESIGHDHFLSFFPKSIIDVDWVSGGNMAFRRKVFREVGFFDENFKGSCHYYESDFCLRLKENGYRIVLNPDTPILHVGSSSGQPRSYYENNWNRMHFFLKHNKKINTTLFFLLILTRIIFLLYKYISERKLEYLKGVKGFLDGFFENFRKLN
ncbi:MAG: glycosyltransferase family 2 protein [Candidatus Lokiarchaeia archaeon]